MVIRVTHIYRRIDGDWKLVHRHADSRHPISEIPLPDKRPAPALCQLPVVCRPALPELAWPAHQNG
jgi:hypothetical protein